MFSVRKRSIAALSAVITAIGVFGSWTGAPVSAAPAPQYGLFGSSDPTYDGVYRQSLAILGLKSAGRIVPSAAASWLVHQQCTDGGFQPVRATSSTACTASDAAGYVGEDSNSTAAAAAALHDLGYVTAATKALNWLKAMQNPDGGFPWFVGGQSDANSTALALLANKAAGISSAQLTKNGHTPTDFLRSLQVLCTGSDTNERGGFAYQDFGTGLVANDSATVSAVLALTGQTLHVVSRPTSTINSTLTCVSGQPATYSPTIVGAGYIYRLLGKYAGAVPQFDYTNSVRLAGSKSLGDTAWAALALSASGIGSSQLSKAVAVLRANESASYSDPGLEGLFLLVYRATNQPAALRSRLAAHLTSLVRRPLAVNRVRPSISGSPSVGRRVTCTAGTWTNSPALSITWLRSGSQTPLGKGATYLIRTADKGTSLRCVVKATTTSGSTTAVSKSRRVTA